MKKYIISILAIYGNPSSKYNLGIESNKLINDARKKVANFIGINNISNLDKKIIFTCSGSASNELAISGLMKNPICRYDLYYSPISHKSMKLACQEYNGIKIPIKNDGFFDLNKLEDLLIKKNVNKPVICFDIANSEIGNIQDYKTIIDIVHKYHGLVICDATGYIPYHKINVIKDDIDLLTFSGHKLGALKGCGVLYKKQNINLFPLIHGSQESGLFGGTENVLGIASLGKAVEIYNYNKISTVNREYLFKQLSMKLSNKMYLIGAKISENRLPNNLYICFKGIKADVLVTALDQFNIQVSTGSACNNGELASADTLKEINVDSRDLNSCIRISLSFEETKDELDYFVNVLLNILDILREE